MGPIRWIYYRVSALERERAMIGHVACHIVERFENSHKFSHKGIQVGKTLFLGMLDSGQIMHKKAPLGAYVYVWHMGMICELRKFVENGASSTLTDKGVLGSKLSSSCIGLLLACVKVFLWA